MKRLLATSLSMALALSLSAVTLLGVASAAGGPAISERLYAHGDVGCLGPDDLSSPVGRVITKATASGIWFQVVFTHAAPHEEYEITLNDKVDDCVSELQRYFGFTTNQTGSGVFRATYETEPGTYEININVVSHDGDVDDPTHRELSTAGFVEVTVR